jgi:parallel beta-helix repeat protein
MYLAVMNFMPFHFKLKKLTHYGFLHLLTMSLVSFFLLSSMAWSATYYVDATKGNDANSGLSEATPWKAIAKVNASNFNPGDQILFKRGEVWRENLNPPSDGLVDNPLTFNAYGEGSLPKIVGSDSRTGAANWKQESLNTWFTEGISWVPPMVFHDGIGSSIKTSKANLKNNWDWWHDSTNNRIYFFLNENPGNHTIEIVRRDGIGFSGAKYIAIKNFEIAFARYGIGLWGGSYWLIDSLYIHEVTHTGIQGNNNSKAVTVQNSTFQDWNWRGYRAKFGDGESYMGYGIQVISSTGGASDDWVITGNTLRIVNMESGEDTTAINIDQQGHTSLIAKNIIIGRNGTGGGIMFWRPKGNVKAIIQENVIQDCAHTGINASEFNVNNFTAGFIIDRNIITNSCMADINDHEVVRVWTGNATPIIVRNNLIDTTVKGTNQHPGIRIRQSRGVTVYNNTIYNTDVGISVERNSSSVLIKNNISTANRVAAFSVDDTSSVSEGHNDFFGSVFGCIPASTTIRLDPLFVDVSSKNFRLQAASQAIDSGTDMGEGQLDLAGNHRPVGSGWDMGAFEFNQSSQLRAPQNLRILSNQ